MNESPPRRAVSATTWLMLAILVWGLVLALGTYLYGRNQPGLRALLVIGCTLGFLALWATALSARRAKYP
jgi:hypothetical protein